MYSNPMSPYRPVLTFEQAPLITDGCVQKGLKNWTKVRLSHSLPSVFLTVQYISREIIERTFEHAQNLHCTHFWNDKNAELLHADDKDPEQTAKMRRLI